VAVKTDCIAADDEVANLRGGELREEIREVRW
jgi:hypothetical protein